MNARREGVSLVWAMLVRIWTRPRDPSMLRSCCFPAETSTFAPRTYYGCFCVAEAFLSDKGVDVSAYAGVMGEYGRLFARTGRLDRRFHRLPNRAFRARQSADYDLCVDLGAAEVRGLIAEGKAFLETARDYFGHENAEEAAEQE